MKQAPMPEWAQGKEWDGWDEGRNGSGVSRDLICGNCHFELAIADDYRLSVNNLGPFGMFGMIGMEECVYSLPCSSSDEARDAADYIASRIERVHAALGEKEEEAQDA